MTSNIKSQIKTKKSNIFIIYKKQTFKIGIIVIKKKSQLQHANVVNRKKDIAEYKKKDSFFLKKFNFIKQYFFMCTFNF